MNTPRKNYEALESPYAKHLSQYPSQSEGFLPFDLGGPGTGNHGNRQTPNRNMRYTSTPAKYDPYSGASRGGLDTAHKFTPRGGGGQQNRQQYRSMGHTRFAEGGRHSQGGDNDNNFQRKYNNAQGARGNGGFRTQQKFNNQNSAVSYFHPSMLEDPWRELMQRHNAIRNSEINIENQQKHDVEKQNAKSTSSPESMKPLESIG